MVVVALLAGNLFLTVVILALFMKIRAQVGEAAANAIEPLAGQIDSAQNALEVKFGAATTDMAERLERTKGDLRQGVTDRLTQGFSEIRTTVEAQLSGGRREQTQDLREARTELTTSLALTTSQLKIEFENLNQKTAQSLDSIRDRLNLLSRGQEWAARKTEVALALAPADGPIHDYLTAMANRHRAEVEWGRAEVIRLMSAS